MTFHVGKSVVALFGGQYEIMVAKHASEVRAWLAHDARVKLDEKNGVPKEEAYQAHPPPTAHDLIARAVDETGVVDYAIFDDGPSPEQKLVDAKNKLFAEAHIMEQRAEHSIMPPAKTRITAVRVNRIIDADSARRTELLRQIADAGIIDKLIGRRKQMANKIADVTAERSPADQAIMAEHEARMAEVKLLKEHFAQVLSDIDDLTIDTVGAYRIPEFQQ